MNDTAIAAPSSASADANPSAGALLSSSTVMAAAGVPVAVEVLVVPLDLGGSGPHDRKRQIWQQTDEQSDMLPERAVGAWPRQAIGQVRQASRPWPGAREPHPGQASEEPGQDGPCPRAISTPACNGDRQNAEGKRRRVWNQTTHHSRRGQLPWTTSPSHGCGALPRQEPPSRWR